MEVSKHTTPQPIPRARARRARRGVLSPAFLLVLGLLAASARADVSGTVVAAKPATLRAPAVAPQPAAVVLEQKVLEQINEVRKQRGLEPMQFSQDLRAPAREHSQYMAVNQKLTHHDTAGRGVGERLDGEGIRWIRYGENVGLVKGYANPVRTVVDAWLRSPGHAANIFNPSLTESAVGVAVAADGTYYLTQVFVTR